MAARSAIRAITFDLDDTLWEIGPTLLRAEQRLHDWLERHYPLITQRYDNVQLRDLRHGIIARRPELAHDLTALRKEGLKLAAQQVGYIDTEFDHEAAFEVFFTARNDVVLFADTLPTLQHLTTQYTLAALTNGNADIHLTGLGQLLSFAINAAEVGASKPEPAMFLAACERLDLAPGQIVHVGDDPTLDVAGATAAGLRTVWLNRRNKTAADYGSGYKPADAEIASLTELAEVLAAWEIRQN